MIAKAALVFCFSALATGCVARVVPEPVYAEATYVPTDIEYYPHTTYGGRVVYLVNDHWYYRDGPRWVYYRQEPPGLYRQRPYVYRQRPYVQQAPRAPEPYYRHGPYRQDPYRQGPPMRGVPRGEAPAAIPAR